MVESSFINLCDSSNEDGSSLPNMVVPFSVNSQLVEKQPLHLDVPQVIPFTRVVDSLKSMSLTLHASFKLKSLNYDTITIEFVNCFPTKFNGDSLFELPHVRHPLGHSAQLQGMDRKYNGHAWYKLQTNNINNVFGLGFQMTKCLGHLYCQNDSCLLFQQSSSCNEVSWIGDYSQPSIVKQCLMKSLIYTISYKFCNSSPTCLQTCSCIMLFTNFQIFQKPQSTWAPIPSNYRRDV
jgi:hypothetical protein